MENVMWTKQNPRNANDNPTTPLQIVCLCEYLSLWRTRVEWCVWMGWPKKEIPQGDVMWWPGIPEWRGGLGWCQSVPEHREEGREGLGWKNVGWEKKM